MTHIRGGWFCSVDAKPSATKATTAAKRPATKATKRPATKATKPAAAKATKRPATKATKPAAAKATKPAAAKATTAAKPPAGRGDVASNSLSDQALAIADTNPGIALPEMAERIGVGENFLEFVLHGLETAGELRRQGDGWRRVRKVRLPKSAPPS